LRCFDFWRLEKAAPHRAAINQTLEKAAQKAGRRGITLMIENEPSCNTASSKEAAEVLASIPHPNFKLLWDPGNSWFAGLDPFPEGYHLLPAARIAHVHCKDAVKNAAGKPEWAAVGRGKINFSSLFAALSRDGFSGALSLETHWRGAGSAEESTRQSMKGLKEALAKAQVSWK
jgi:sugar phosphate isomerase/epimerase